MTWWSFRYSYAIQKNRKICSQILKKIVFLDSLQYHANFDYRIEYQVGSRKAGLVKHHQAW